MTLRLRTLSRTSTLPCVTRVSVPEHGPGRATSCRGSWPRCSGPWCGTCPCRRPTACATWASSARPARRCCTRPAPAERELGDAAGLRELEDAGEELRASAASRRRSRHRRDLDRAALGVDGRAERDARDRVEVLEARAAGPADPASSRAPCGPTTVLWNSGVGVGVGVEVGARRGVGVGVGSAPAGLVLVGARRRRRRPAGGRRRADRSFGPRTARCRPPGCWPGSSSTGGWSRRGGGELRVGIGTPPSPHGRPSELTLPPSSIADGVGCSSRAPYRALPTLTVRSCRRRSSPGCGRRLADVEFRQRPGWCPLGRCCGSMSRPAGPVAASCCWSARARPVCGELPVIVESVIVTATSPVAPST